MRVQPAILVAIIVSTGLYGISTLTVAHAAGPTGDFSISPPFILAGGNDSFTATIAGGTLPYELNWTFGDGTHPVSSHTGSSQSYGINATTSTTTPTTTTSVSCSPGSVRLNSPTTCSATVRDISTAPITPTRTVTFVSNAVGTFSPPTASCALSPSTLGNATCSVVYTPTSGAGVHSITGIYSGDPSHTGTSSGKYNLSVTILSPSHSTTTWLSCAPGSISVGKTTSCTVTVNDTSASPTTPTGNVILSSDSSGNFVNTSPCVLSTGTIFGTSFCTFTYTPTSAGSGTHTITVTYTGNNGIVATHIFGSAGTYTTSVLITDSTGASTKATHNVVVHGTTLSFFGWTVNWNITDFHGVEIYNSSYNGVMTIRDAIINGISVIYFQQPPGFSCLFFDDLGHDDLAGSIAGFTVQNSTDPSNPWFQIRANYNPSQVGYNYTQFWRFYKNGEWDATLYVGHLGCGWNHYYQPHFRIDLAIGNKNRDLMSQYTPGGNWRNLIWEGNYTDNGFRDQSHNATQWRFGDGTGYYYIVPKVLPYATDFPKIAPKIYLVKDRPGELEPDINPPPRPMDPINFVDGELAYRQSIAFWYLPTFGDHWLYSVGSPPIGYPSIVSLSFYPSGI